MSRCCDASFRHRWFLAALLVGYTIPALRWRLNYFMLDLLSLPGAVIKAFLNVLSYAGFDGMTDLGLKINANWHLAVVCPFCPKGRRTMRDPSRNGFCLWNYHWQIGNLWIPPDFGPANWFAQYLDGETDLSSYLHLDPRNQKPVIGGGIAE